MAKHPEFSPWPPWTDAKSIEGVTSLAGVYMFARFARNPNVTPDPTDTNVIYIGETCANTIAGRWYQFGRSAFFRKSGHSGGWTFSDTYLDATPQDPPDWLYVTALPVDLEEPHLSAFIRYKERLLLWEYVQAHGQLPACNSK